MNYPVLYKKTSTGAIQQWKIEVTPNADTTATITTVYGQVAGAQQIASDVIYEGKNIGKKNETSPIEQAFAEAGSQWDAKQKKGYVESYEDAKAGKVNHNVILGGVPVMLAHKFAEQGHKIKYPCFLQPKLDGHRCIAIVQNGTCTLWSRTQKRITGVPHIADQLVAMFPGEGTIVLDGELYHHDIPFETIASYVRQEKPKPGHEIVQYWIYDMINEDPFFLRINKLEEFKSKDQIVFVETFLIDTEEWAIASLEDILLNGYEGVMLRNSDGKYVSKRSYDLQKMKKFDDAEFEIVRVEAGRGKMSDKGVFICKTAEGVEFGAKMVGDMSKLTEYLTNQHKYIGKWLTVKYQGLTGKNSVPRFPVAMRIRDSE